VAAARRHAALTAGAALVLAGVAGLATALAGWAWTSGPGSLGVTALLVPVAAGVTHTVVLLLGELTWPRPVGEVRRARLVRRGPWDPAPRWLVVLATVVSSLTAAVIAVGALTAAPDGRSLTLGSDDGLVSSTASPYPGLTYGAAAAAGLVLLALVTVTALVAVANRAAVVTADDRIETALRQASAHRVLRGATAAVCIVGGGLLHIGGQALAGVAGSGTAATIADHRLLGVAGTVLAVLGPGVVLAGVVIACVRAPGVPAGQPLPVG